MAMLHMDVGKIRKGAGAERFARYITREDERDERSEAERHADYVQRNTHAERGDLLAAGHANLPTWAKDDPGHFFAMANRYEHKTRLVARYFECSLPRELVSDANRAVADDIRAVLFERHPHVWGIHAPLASDGLPQPHLHVQFSERIIDEVERTPKGFFQGQGKARKDPSWKPASRLKEMREAVATLTNAALERAGYEVAVSAATLKERGHEREVPRYGKGEEQSHVADVQAVRQAIREQHHPDEQAWALLAWQEQRQREGIGDISREAMIDHVREWFWARDTSVYRVTQRDASFMRSLEREYGREETEDRAMIRPRQGHRRKQARDEVAGEEQTHGQGTRQRGRAVPWHTHEEDESFHGAQVRLRGH